MELRFIRNKRIPYPRVNIEAVLSAKVLRFAFDGFLHVYQFAKEKVKPENTEHIQEDDEMSTRGDLHPTIEPLGG
jgi:hypothetical protein